jgi:two-component sensor histidine kinase
VAQAIAIGLIINEGVTNSIKYAFPKERDGLIDVAMEQTAEGISLTIADNGIGMDPAMVDKGSASMGLKLIKGLVDDLNGEVRFSVAGGAKITIHFSADELADVNRALVIETEQI